MIFSINEFDDNGPAPIHNDSDANDGAPAPRYGDVKALSGPLQRVRVGEQAE